MIRDVSGRVLPGDWRRRTGSRTDAHLYRDGSAIPMCGRRIARDGTTRVEAGRSCTECLVAAITRRVPVKIEITPRGVPVKIEITPRGRRIIDRQLEETS